MFLREAAGNMESDAETFGSRRIYYNNFASHLLNAYNPNVFYPGLPYEWDEERWRRVLKADYGHPRAGFGSIKSGIQSRRGSGW